MHSRCWCWCWCMHHSEGGAVFIMVASVQERLMAEISDTQTDYATAVRAIEVVELLKAEGLAAAQASNPLAAFANSQREFLQQRLRFLVESHVHTVTSIVGIEVPHPSSCLPHRPQCGISRALERSNYRQCYAPSGTQLQPSHDLLVHCRCKVLHARDCVRV